MPAEAADQAAAALAAFRAPRPGLALATAKAVAPEQCEALAGDLVVFAGPLAALATLAWPGVVDRLVVNPGTYAALGLAGRAGARQEAASCA